MTSNEVSKIPKEAPKVRNKEQVIAPIFAEQCDAKMKELGTNPMQLAAKVHMQYDTIRKACKGIAFAGNKVLPPVCKELGLDLEQMQRIIIEEKMAYKGFVPGDLDLIDTLLLQINETFSNLPQKDKKDAISYIRKLADKKND